MPVPTSPRSVPDRREDRLAQRTAALVLACLAALTALAFPVREPLYRAVAEAAATSSAAPLVALTAEAALLLLVATAGGIAVLSWRRARRSFWVLAAGGVGVVMAYLLSELVKVLVAEDRPCRALDVTAVLPCPPVGDWSWPSNHATLAAAFATACLLAAPRVTPWVCAVALLVAGSRVAAGVHYVHDVLAGLVVGSAVVLLAVMLLRPLLRRLPGSLVRHPGSGRSY